MRNRSSVQPSCSLGSRGPSAPEALLLRTSEGTVAFDEAGLAEVWLTEDEGTVEVVRLTADLMVSSASTLVSAAQVHGGAVVVDVPPLVGLRTPSELERVLFGVGTNPARRGLLYGERLEPIYAPGLAL